MSTIRTRFAPSPTGSMHIGNLRTAFYAYALAKHDDGDFILRIEDTDKKREKEGGVEDIKRLLGIFGIKWDEYYIQSERLGKYKVAAEKLVNSGHAFYCQCEAKNAKLDGFSNELRDPCRDKKFTSGAIKLLVPDNEGIGFTDFVINKKVSWSTNIVGDATLLKSDGFPTYHLAVVVDDTDMKITHVLRGHDWMPSTPIHLLVYKYLGFEVPQIGHLTDIMDPDGGKLSKRKGSTSVQGLLDEGYLPEALFNFVILCGWAPKNNKELFTLEEFVKEFDQSGFQKSNPVFNREKLDWFNGEYIRSKTNDEIFMLAKVFFEDKYSDEQLKRVVPLVKERIKKIKDIESLAGFILDDKSPEPLTSMTFQSTKASGATINYLENIKEWNLDNLNHAFGAAIQESGLRVGEYYMGLRGTISGSKFTPPISESIEILGKDKTIERLKKGEEKYNQKT